MDRRNVKRVFSSLLDVVFFLYYIVAIFFSCRELISSSETLAWEFRPFPVLILITLFTCLFFSVFILNFRRSCGQIIMGIDYGLPGKPRPSSGKIILSFYIRLFLVLSLLGILVSGIYYYIKREIWYEKSLGLRLHYRKCTWEH